MLAVANLADLLGLSANRLTSPLGLVSRIESGLPVGALERIVRLVAPDDRQFKYRLVPRATLERRKRGGLSLSSEEGMRVARLARVWGLAVDVWKSEREARDFLFRKHAMLEDRLPVDIVIQNEIGAELVIDILQALKYGSAA